MLIEIDDMTRRVTRVAYADPGGTVHAYTDVARDWRDFEWCYAIDFMASAVKDLRKDRDAWERRGGRPAKKK